MKRILLLSFLLLSVLCINARNHGHWKTTMTQPVATNGWTFENDTVKVDMFIAFQSLEGDKLIKSSTDDEPFGYFYFQLENKTSKRLYIEWENARLDGDRPTFGTDNMLNAKDKKEDELVVSGSKSITRSLFVDANHWSTSSALGENVRTPWLNYKLKETGIQTIDFLLPLRFADGSTDDIKFQLQLIWENTGDVSQVKEGMKEKEVKSLLGSPERKRKAKSYDTEVWYYTNNADITFTKGIVTSIEKVK